MGSSRLTFCPPTSGGITASCGAQRATQNSCSNSRLWGVESNALFLRPPLLVGGRRRGPCPGLAPGALASLGIAWGVPRRARQRPASPPGPSGGLQHHDSQSRTFFAQESAVRGRVPLGKFVLKHQRRTLPGNASGIGGTKAKDIIISIDRLARRISTATTAASARGVAAAWRGRVGAGEGARITG